VGIYGSSGYLGSKILSVTHDAIPLAREAIPGNSKFIFDFSFPNHNFKAHIFSEYITLIKRRLDFCSLNNIKYFYAGSTSSYPPSLSKYSKQKMEIETLVKSNKGIVIRQGLVINESEPGGRYKDLSSKIRNLPMLIYPDPSTFRLMVTTERDFITTWRNLPNLEELNKNDLIVKNSYESSLFDILKSVETDEKFSLYIGIKLSLIFQSIIRHLPLKSLDSLRSISIQKEYIFDDAI